ncbi:MAG: gliding motility protein GldM [Bacteroidetes bacterium]|nr:gliding motility protein GldM [Bacteroidota bacterium]
MAGKETPRQKMIGMMYLVLTALLALNVSKDAVEAFKLVDKSLTKTTENFSSKNELIYQEFDQAASENPIKAGPWRNIANGVRERADEMYDYIQELKIEIIQTAEGKDTEALEGDVIIVEHIRKIDENNIPSQILVGSDQNGKAFDMKAAMEEYRGFLMDIVGNKNVSVSSSIEAGLNTDDPVIKGEKQLWVNHMFQASPLIASITLLSKLQSDVRNAEAETINFLYQQIDAGAFKFNKLIQTVITNSNYIMKGNEYKAEVFIAATDTTQQPEVLVGKYETTVNANGIKEYRMIGDYQTLTVDERGRGIYKLRPTVLGDKTWGGLIKMKAPDGSIINYPFQAKYTVAPPNVVVSPTAMNVFYVGVQNPVDISVSGASSDKTYATMTNGTIKRGTTRKFRGSFIASPRTPGQIANVTVTAEINGEKRSFAPIPFRVEVVPDPVAKVGDKNSGSIAKSLLEVQVAVFAELENFLFDIHYDITAFTIEITDRGFTVTEASSSHRITAAQKTLINRLKRDSRIVFTDVKAVGPDGRQRSLPPIVLRIE